MARQKITSIRVVYEAEQVTVIPCTQTGRGTNAQLPKRMFVSGSQGGRPDKQALSDKLAALYPPGLGAGS